MKFSWKPSVANEKVNEVDPTWTKKDLKGKKGVYALTPVAELLDIPVNKIVRELKKFERPFAEIGVSQLFGMRYFVQLDKFLPWALKTFPQTETELKDDEEYGPLPDEIRDFHSLLEYEGIARFPDVARLFPYSEPAFRKMLNNRIRKYTKEGKSPREEIGAFVHKGHILIDVPKFRQAMFKEMPDEI